MTERGGYYRGREGVRKVENCLSGAEIKLFEMRQGKRGDSIEKQLKLLKDFNLHTHTHGLIHTCS